VRWAKIGNGEPFDLATESDATRPVTPEEIYFALAQRVVGYLRARGVTDPEDVAGEVFLQVARDLRRFRDAPDEIAVRRCADSDRIRQAVDMALGSAEYQVSTRGLAEGIAAGQSRFPAAIYRLVDKRLRRSWRSSASSTSSSMSWS